MTCSSFHCVCTLQDSSGNEVKLPSVVVGVTLQSRYSGAGTEFVKEVQIFSSNDGKNYSPVDGGKTFKTGCKPCSDEKCDIFFNQPVCFAGQTLYEAIHASYSSTRIVAARCRFIQKLSK